MARGGWRPYRRCEIVGSFLIQLSELHTLSFEILFPNPARERGYGGGLWGSLQLHKGAKSSAAADTGGGDIVPAFRSDTCSRRSSFGR